MAQVFSQLTPQLWVAQSALFHTNSGIWIAERDACLVDPGIHPDEIAAIARFVAAQGATVQTIILTHSHWDHILGPEQFPGARVVAQAEYLRVVRDHSAVILKELGEWITQRQVPRAHPFVIPTPDVTFDAAQTLPLGDLTLHLAHAPGHAPDQFTVYEPARGVLWAADMLSDVEIPFAGDNVAAYYRTLSTLAARTNVRLLIPGHGTPTTDPTEIGARFAADTGYLAALLGRVTEAVAHGKSVQDAVAACADLLYRDPAVNADPHRWNVESAYLELGGPGDPLALGWGQWSV